MQTMTYTAADRVARITLDRPQRGNGLTRRLIDELAAAVERADLDPAVHVILLSGRGSGFCGGYDLGVFAERGFDAADINPDDIDTDPATGTLLDPGVHAANHDPARTWDPMVD